MLRRVASDIEQAFPLVARRTGLVLFDRDPDHLQAQWQVETADLQRACDAFAGGASEVRLQLRLLRLDGATNEGPAAVLSAAIKDGEIEGTARFQVSDHGSTYQAELGVANSDGGWLLLVRSNRVQLPGPVGRAIPARTGAEAPREPVATPSAATEVGVRSGASPLPVVEGASMPVGETSPWRSDPGSSPPFDPTLADNGIRLPPVFPDAFPRAGWSPKIKLPRVLDLLDAPTPETQAIPMPVSARPIAGTRDGPAQVMETTESPPSTHPSSQSSQTAMVDDMPLFPAFDPYHAISSGNHGAGLPEQADLEIHTELLVYGRAAPGSRLHLFGQSLDVGASGRFCLRRVLDGPLSPSGPHSGSPAAETGEPKSELDPEPAPE